MVYLENVSKVYGGTTVVQPLTLSLATGRTTVLIGPSGCGKSTLLRLIVGLIPADTGTVYLGDTALTPANVQILRRRMGYVIQEGGLFPHMTAAANITVMAGHLGWPRERIAARLEELARLVRFPSALTRRYPGELSGGQRQRVGLMRAMMLDPDVLLLDEPLGALDPMIRYDLQQDLKQVFADLGKTVLLVTHDLSEAAFFADHIVLLREGRVVQQGGIRDLLESPVEPFVQQFIRAQRLPLDVARGPET